MSDPADTRFALPAVDDPPLTEIGVILLGLDAERLLAGLGLAALADDPTLVTLAVDQARHGSFGRFGEPALIAAGAARWAAVWPTLAARPSPVVAGSVRETWERTVRAVASTVAGTVAGVGTASTAYLAACWLRHEDIEPLTEREGAP